jgi:hypothetical protein
MDDVRPFGSFRIARASFRDRSERPTWSEDRSHEEVRAEASHLIAKLGPTAKAPFSKKGFASGSDLGVDVEAFLELLQQASRGLGEIVRSIDEMVSQVLLWVRKIDSSLPRCVRKFLEESPTKCGLRRPKDSEIRI